MATREEIRAVFADPQNDGMEALYQSIGEMLQDGAEFENAYSLVIAAGDTPANTWIRFCVQCATRFDDPPEESEFLAVLEEFSRRQACRSMINHLNSSLATGMHNEIYDPCFSLLELFSSFLF